MGARGLFIEALWVTHQLTHLWATVQSLITTCFCGCGATDLAMAGCGGTIRAWEYSSIATTPRKILDVNVFLISAFVVSGPLWIPTGGFGWRAKVQQFNLTFRVPAPRKRWIPNSEPAIYFQELKNGKSFFVVFNISRCPDKTKIANRTRFCPSTAVT